MSDKEEDDGPSGVGTCFVVGLAILSGCIGKTYGENVGWATFGLGLMIIALIAVLENGVIAYIRKLGKAK